ncbi:T9SS type A sorting domain-containing protein [Gaetbulibacter sp. M235]|uniref:T9SS type A sorting domain-containing protein n=1 Tax=Gaetbulibacter sp. M235 TaxID=3126510 RepID=UPI00374E7E45
MKHLLLFVLFIFLSISAFAQIQGLPPPCGYTPAYACDDNDDGFSVFNLVDLFGFYSLCPPQGEVPEDYESLVFYLTQEDRDNETNPIANPEVYTNISSPQIIYFRANAINSGGTYEYLTNEDPIEVKRLVTDIPSLDVYDNDSDGIAVFDLTSVNLFCGTNDESNYVITYHELQQDAVNGINAISNPSSFVNKTNADYIYARVEHKNTGYVEVTSYFYLRVLFAEANTPVGVNICDDDFDAIYTFDLESKNAEILGNQNSDNFTVSYYLNQSDAETKTNPLPTIYNVSNSQTIFARVDENTKGSYAITSFSFLVFTPPVVSLLDAYEICDDNEDGIETFDLSSKDAEIIGEQTDVSISYHLTQADAEVNTNTLPTYFTNFATPQTIYVRVENLLTGCSTITTLDLLVRDCSQAGVIEINAFYDANSDTTFDNDEINFLSGTLTYEKNNDGIKHVLYSSTGIFNIISNVETDTYDIGYSIYDEFHDCYNLTTYLYENVSVANGSRVNYVFPVTKIKECSDVAVYLTQVNPPRPGFDYATNLIIRNLGIETVTSGSVEFIKDDLITFKNVIFLDSGNSITNTPTGFILNFNNLQPNKAEHVVVNMNAPVSVNLGDLLTSTVIYSVDDLDISNNTSTLIETVVGSYDPNDIAESHGSEIFYDDFSSSDYLYYTIRFQNVGTADAINVSIDNTVDSKLDKSTIQMLSASHDYVFTRTNNQLNWKFDSINLPSESDDEPNSHGYVYYKIKPLAGYKVGDIIPNTAEIYFDFNPAVVTNTFETEFVETLSNKKLNNVDFTVFPNPTKNTVELKFNKSLSDVINVRIYDIQGKLILNKTRKLQKNSVNLDVSNLKSGLYFLKIIEDDYEVIKKLIKK